VRGNLLVYSGSVYRQSQLADEPTVLDQARFLWITSLKNIPFLNIISHINFYCVYEVCMKTNWTLQINRQCDDISKFVFWCFLGIPVFDLQKFLGSKFVAVLKWQRFFRRWSGIPSPNQIFLVVVSSATAAAAVKNHFFQFFSKK